ncbi:GNAT family N-acetyltransferase [Ilumatobacter sp.]|uniref:GNAT family N-acetyltransferase n=1 Tax=Ilumatobacter sp. TaxID=1967498 RepID=UPI003AF49840
MTRTRSEYRLSPIPTEPATTHPLAFGHPNESRREELAVLLLDAYRNTIDDEGEDLDDAREAIDTYLAIIQTSHSFVVVDGDRPVAFSFVVIVDGVHYIDPVVVRSDRKREGLGRVAVRLCLDSLAGADVTVVGATVTDGNIASERLFASLGFTCHGVWA